MRDLRLFRFKDITVESPDDISEAITKIESLEDARSLIIKIANHITPNDTKQLHIRHACKICSRIANGDSVHISDAILCLW